MVEQCGNCYFGRNQAIDGSTVFACCRYAPVVLPDRRGFSAWPPVAADDWCGDYSLLDPDIYKTPAPVLLNTLTAANSATLDDMTSITAAYDVYLILFENVVPVTNNDYLRMRISVDAGATWEATTYVDWPSANAAALSFLLSAQVSNGAGMGLTGHLYLMAPNKTDVRKLFHGTTFFANATYGAAITPGGYWNGSNVALNGIRFFFLSGNISTGRIRVYGIKTA